MHFSINLDPGLLLQYFLTFQNTNLVHNSFNLQQYICYTNSSTCFEQHAAHHQEDQLYHHSLWYRHPL